MPGTVGRLDLNMFISCAWSVLVGITCLYVAHNTHTRNAYLHYSQRSLHSI